MNLQTIKNEIAVEIGYSNFDDYMRELILNCSDYSVERLNKITDEICIRAQKAALEKAADSAKVQYYNTRTEKKESASAMGNKGQVYSVDRTSITNPKNLIQ